MSTIDLSQLSSAGRNAVAIVKEGGVVVVCLLIVAFFFGQKAGWIPDIEQQLHRSLELQHGRLFAETSDQTTILRENQAILHRQLEMMERNQRSQMRLTRGLCISITKTSEAEKRCLGED